MVIYLANLISIPLWYFLLRFFQHNLQRVQNTVVAIVCVQMVVIAGLRGLTVGTDTMTYSDIFWSVDSLPWTGLFSYYIEPGYSLLAKIISFLSKNYSVMLFVSAAISLWGIRNFINKTCKNKCFALFLFITIGYFSSMMNVMRQYLALVFMLNVYVCVIKRDKWYKTALNILIACLFHKSAILISAVIVIYYILYLSEMKYARQIKLIVMSVALILVVFLKQIISLLSFLDYEYLQTGAAFEVSLFSPTFIMKLIFIAICLYIEIKCKDKIADDDLHLLRFFRYIIIVSCLLNIGSVSFNMLTRLNIYFTIVNIAWIPNIIELLPIKPKWPMIICTCAVFTATYLLDLFGGGNDIVPYVFMK